MSSSQNQTQQSATGGRPTGATGGGYNRYPCMNWQQEGHPQNYNFVDQKDRLCAHCMVSSISSTVSLCANYPISAHPAGAERKAL
jgi:hypothetical protein